MTQCLCLNGSDHHGEVVCLDSVLFLYEKGYFLCNFRFE